LPAALGQLIPEVLGADLIERAQLSRARSPATHTAGRPTPDNFPSPMLNSYQPQLPTSPSHLPSVPGSPSGCLAEKTSGAVRASRLESTASATWMPPNRAVFQPRVVMDRRRLPWVLVIFGAVLAFLVVAAVFAPPVVLRLDLGRRVDELTAAETAAAVNQIRSAIVQGIAALVVLAGAYIGWRQLLQNTRAATAQVESQRIGALTDRYTRAVDQLSSTDETIRVGAIHAFDRIAAEAPSERAGVIALLATYVRVRARRGWTSFDDPDLPLRSRAADIQAALTTFTRWIEPGEVPAQWLSADIAHADLPNANLSKCTLWHLRMRDVNLMGASLTQADLRGADLRGAVLDGVDFSGACGNRRTWWPAGFDPTAHGVTIEDDETNYAHWPLKDPQRFPG
jgi:hypothetical protein